MDNALKKQKLPRARYTARFLAVCAAAWVVFALVALDLSARLALCFVLYAAAGVALPGAALLELSGLRLRAHEALVVSGAFGLASQIALYYALAALGALNWALAATAALAIGSIAVLWLKRKSAFAPAGGERELRDALALAALALVLTSTLLSAATLDPSFCGVRAYHPDILFGASFSLSSAAGSTPSTFLVNGAQYTYYPFFYVFSAMLQKALAAGAFEAVTKLALVLISPFAVCALYCVARYFIPSRRAALALSALFALLPPSVYVYYFYKDCLGFPLGLGFALLGILLFFRASAETEHRFRYDLAASLMLALCVGAKAPLIVTPLFGLCFCLLMRLIRERDWSVIPRGLLYVVPVFAVYFLVYKIGINKALAFLPLYKALNSEAFVLLSSALPSFLAAPLSVLWYIISLDPLSALLVAALAVLSLRKGGHSYEADFCVSGVLLGWILMNLFFQQGGSERYFALIMTPFIYAVGSSRLLERLKKANKKALWALAAAALLPCLAANAVSSLPHYIGNSNPYYLTGGSAALRYSRFGNALEGASADSFASTEPERARSVSAAEYEALLWIRDNTPEDAVIAAGAYIAYNRNSASCVFSERRFYLDGYYSMLITLGSDLDKTIQSRDLVMRMLFEEGNANVLAYLRDDGVDYLLVHKVFYPDLVIPPDAAEMVYENAEAAVYKLK